MLQALHAEWQKARRRHDLVLCLTFAVILYLWLGSTAPTGQDELANAYSALFFGVPIINTILLPVLMAVLASRLWDVEVKGYTAKLLYTLQSRRSLFFGKAVFGLGEIVLMVALEAAVLLLLGHTQGYTEAFPAGQFAYLNLCTLTVCTMLYFSELLLALWFSNPLPAVCVGVIGALLATWARGLENDVYFQIGMLVMIGLAAKNAILIVEFAVELRHKGMDLVRAAIDAGELRFRPIIMTSLAFIGGTIPLAVATGAGAASRHSLGTGIVGGMIGVSTLALLFVPIFYVWFEGWAERSGAKSALKLAAKLSSRNIPITDKLRTAILRGPGTVYDPNATVKVSPSGELTVINSPGFNPEGVENQDIGIGDLTSQEQKANVESADKLTDLEREKSVKEDKTEITKEVLSANEVSQKAADAKNNKGEGK